MFSKFQVARRRSKFFMGKMVFKVGFEEKGKVLTQTNRRRQISFPGRKNNMNYGMETGKYTKDYDQGISKINPSWEFGVKK